MMLGQGALHIYIAARQDRVGVHAHFDAASAELVDQVGLRVYRSKIS